MNTYRIILFLVLLLPGLQRIVGAQEFPYRKEATREATVARFVAEVAKTSGRADVRWAGGGVIGPFELRREREFEDKRFVGRSIDYEQVHRGANDKIVRWKKSDASAVGLLPLAQTGREDMASYHHRRLVSDREIGVALLVDSLAGMSVWVNGRKESDSSTGMDVISSTNQVVYVMLEKGTNDVLIRIVHSENRPSLSLSLAPLMLSDLSVLKAWHRRLEDALETDFPLGESTYYRIRDIAIPDGVELEVGGMDFMPDGRLMIATRRGEIWSFDPGKGAWKRFASGLHEPLGVCVTKEGDLLVAQRPELTRIRDTDGDGEADSFESLVTGFGLSGNYHEYHFGPAKDRDGNLFASLNIAIGAGAEKTTQLRGAVYQFTTNGTFVPWASGFRSPSGIGVSPDGDLFVTDNQGDWKATSPLYHVTQGGFYGHPASLKWLTNSAGPLNTPSRKEPDILASRKAPAVWFVYDKLGHSPTQPVWDMTVGKFGPFGGQMLVGDQTLSMLMRVNLEKVRGVYQGAVFPFRRGFASGILRLAWAGDGSLYVGQTSRGWGSTGGRSMALQRVAWTGAVPMEVASMSLTPTGFDLQFTRPVEKDTAGRATSYSMQCYGYDYNAGYGSPPSDIRAVPVKKAEVSADGRRVSLTLSEVLTGKVYELHIKGVKSVDGVELLHPEAYYTVNQLR